MRSKKTITRPTNQEVLNLNTHMDEQHTSSQALFSSLHVRYLSFMTWWWVWSRQTHTHQTWRASEYMIGHILSKVGHFPSHHHHPTPFHPSLNFIPCLPPSPVYHTPKTQRLPLHFKNLTLDKLPYPDYPPLQHVHHNVPLNLIQQPFCSP
jgi:hypothetical protein